MAVRPLRWVLTARDQTGSAFRSMRQAATRTAQAVTRVARAFTFIRFGVGGVTQAMRNMVFGGAQIHQMAVGFNSTAEEVDGLAQQFDKAGASVNELQQMLQSIQTARFQAMMPGGEQMASLFEQFGLDPQQQNDVKTLTTLFENIQSGRVGLEAGFLSQLIGQDAVKFFNLVRGAVPDVAGAAAQADTLTGRQAQRQNEALGAVQDAGTSLARFAQRGIDQFLPFLRGTAATVRERDVGAFMPAMRQGGFNTQENMFAVMVQLLGDIRSNTRDAGRLGR